MTALHPSETAQALYRSILHAPECDTARLAWADCLEESAGTVECPGCNGKRMVKRSREGPDWYDGSTLPVKNCPTCSGSGRVSDGLAERAEFIRVQVELARLPDGHCEAELESKRCDQLLGYHTDHWCNSCRLRSRASALLRAHEATWRRGARCERCGGSGKYQYRSGNIISKDVFTCWMGALARSVPTAGSFVWEHKAEWQRGLIYKVHAPLANIWQDEKPTPWALRVRGQWPVTEWVATDREPADRVSVNGKWYWFRNGRNALGDWQDQNHLPDAVFDQLKDSKPDTIGLPYDSPDAARTALALAIGEVVGREWMRTQTPAALEQRW